MASKLNGGGQLLTLKFNPIMTGSTLSVIGEMDEYTNKSGYYLRGHFVDEGNKAKENAQIDSKSEVEKNLEIEVYTQLLWGLVKTRYILRIELFDQLDGCLIKILKK